MAHFVIDEWLWSDLAGENDSDRQKETETLLLAIYEICDRLVLVKGSRFEEKTIGFWKHTDIRRRRIAKFYNDSFRYNADKTLPLEQSSLEVIPSEWASGVSVEDGYLVQAQLAVADSVIVTTDDSLKDVCEKNSVPCRSRDEFVSDYLSKYRSRKVS